MGFELKIQKGNMGDEAEIHSVDFTNLAVSFIEIVKQCVAKKILNITVNVNGIEGSFEQIRESVFKLSQFVSSKGYKLKVMGNNLSAQDIADLEKNGLAVLTASKSVSPGFRKMIKDYETTGKFPTDPLLVTDAETHRHDFNKLRDHLEKLEAELKSFRSHKDAISKNNKISLGSAKKELGKIQGQTEKNQQALEEIAKKKVEVAKMNVLVEEEEKKLADFIKRSDSENKKKEEGIKKEINAEKSRFTKVEADFNRQTEVRKKELQKLKAPKPAESPAPPKPTEPDKK